MTLCGYVAHISVEAQPLPGREFDAVAQDILQLVTPEFALSFNHHGTSSWQLMVCLQKATFFGPTDFPMIGTNWAIQ